LTFSSRRLILTARAAWRSLGKSLILFGIILFAVSAVMASGVAERILFTGARLQE